MKPNKTLSITASDGTKLFVRDWGTGPTILFVHSWSMSSDLWMYQMLPLSEAGFRTIAYDARGHGRSEDPGEGFDIETMTDDLANLIEQLDLRDVVLVGHSIGCSQIVRYLAKHGNARVRKIVLNGTTTPFMPLTDDNPGGLNPALVTALQDSWKLDIHQWFDANTDPFFVPTTPASMKHWIWSIAWQTSLKAQIETNRSFFWADLREDAKSVRVPTLIVHGTADASAPLSLTAVVTAELISGSVLKVYEGAPHGLLLTEPARFNADLVEFVCQ